MNKIDSISSLEEEILRLGFLPFFKNAIDGFSIEEMVQPQLWFAKDVDGPWEWKGPLAGTKRCVYGKFFGGKAGFISIDWFPDFANYRRDGYDMDARYDDGLASTADLKMWQKVQGCGTVLSKELKAALNYCKGGNKNFDSVITRLQMQTYVNISGFDYMTDGSGKKYGWGIARYSTPEHWLGPDAATGKYGVPPAESYERIFTHLILTLKATDEKLIKKLIG